MSPKPLQSPLPIYVGGNHFNAYRRAALYGDGWLPAGMPVAQVRENVRHLQALVTEQGRAWEEMDVALQLITYVGKTHEQAIARFHRSQMYNHLVSLGASTLKGQVGSRHEETNLIGTAAEVIEKVQRFQEAGVKHLCGTYFCADTVDELLEQMYLFATDVMPYV